MQQVSKNYNNIEKSNNLTISIISKKLHVKIYIYIFPNVLLILNVLNLWNKYIKYRYDFFRITNHKLAPKILLFCIPIPDQNKQYFI